MTTLPTLRLQHGRDRRVSGGHPWIYSNEIASNAELQALPAGSLVQVVADNGKALGIATYNPKTLLTARILTRDASEAIDAAYFTRRLASALALRERLFDKPFYRLIHAEADGLPGTIIDRFGDVIVVQTNAAGSDALLPPLLDSIQSLLSPRAIVLRNDSPVRELEGLEATSEIVRGALDGPVIVEENGAKFPVELIGGQKTGWFYDQRDNRAYVASLARDARVLDVYTYAGGFGVQCAIAGAKSVICVDRSEPALALVTQAAALNGVADRVTTQRGEAFRALEELRDRAVEKFDVVILDPPAFIKSRKDVVPGLKAYSKLAKLGAALTKPGGFLFIASCSYNAHLPDFTEAVGRGVSDAKRTGRILRTSFAGADHPVHPLLPESAYLKALTLQVD